MRQRVTKSGTIHRVRDAIGVALALLLAAAAATGLLYHSAVTALRAEVHGDLLRLAHAATSLVDGDLHRTLVSPEQFGTESYNRILLPLRAFLQKTPDVKYLFTAVLRDDQVCFGVDSAVPIDGDGDGVIDQAGLLQIYDEAPPCMLTALREGRDATTPEPYTDKWGTFITGFVPFYDSTGAQVGVLGIDVTAGQYEARLATLRTAAATGVAQATLLSLLIGGATWWVRRNTARARLREIVTEEALQGTLRRSQRQQAAVATLAVSPAVSAGDVVGLARELVELAAAATGVERVGVWLFSAEGTELRCIDLYEASAARHSSGTILRRRGYESEFAALESARYVDAHDPLTDPRTAGYVESYLKPMRITSMLDGLIRVEGRTAGTLCFEHVDQPHHWEQDEIAFVCQLGDQLAITMMNQGRKRAEETLKESEERLRAMTEQSADAHFVLDDGRFVDCNRATLDMLRMTTKEELLQCRPIDLSPERQPDGRLSREKAEVMIAQALATGSHRFEWVHHRADGGIFPVEVLITALRHNGKLLLHGVWRDITDRKRAEEALQGKTAVLEAQLNASLDGILVVDPNHRRLLINQQLIEMWSVPPHVVEDEDDTALLNHVVGLTQNPEAFLERVTYLYNHPNETSRDEIEFSNGTILDRYSAPVLGENGRYYGRIWTFRDITERRWAEVALRASETRLQGITDSARDAILMMDPQGAVSYWNPAATSILGYQREEALGQDLHNLLAPERYRADHLAAFSEFIRAGRGGAVGQTVELVARRKDGQEIAVALSLSAFLLDDAWHAVGILRDITAQKQAEKELRDANRHLEEATAQAGEMAMQAEAANRAKSEFLANMSHEIRTPMTAILGFADVLLEQGNLQHAPPERIDAAQTIKSNGEYLLGIINDILDLSKIEAGKMTVERVPCAPCGLIAEVASLMRVRAQAKGLTLDVEYERAIPETIRTDPTRLRQILVNVLANAIKFTETGGVRLITRFTCAADQPRLEFDVTDTGVGLTAEQVARLFRPFTQADASTTRQFGGTGLGLAISKRLAQLLSGSITVVETQPGVGTRFRIAVATGPLDGVRMIDDPAAATTVANERQTQPASCSATPLGGCRILLAEDGPDNQRLISHLLTKAGAAVTVVENGKLAVEAALAARDGDPPFDIVLMDMQMPVLDGYTATSLLRRKGYKRPIIALTAHAMQGDREQCLTAGCDDYATKPIDRRRLIETLLRHVGGGPGVGELAESGGLAAR